MDFDEHPTDPLADPPGLNFVRLGIWFYGAMAIVAVLWRTGIYGEPIFFASTESENQPVAWLANLGLGVAVGLVVVLLSGIATRVTKWGDELARAMAETLGPISTPDAILLAVASGMAEEMLFRGALQPRVGLIVATVLFAAVHFVPRREFLPWTAFALVVGIVFGLMFEATGNLLAPIVAHAVINGINLPMLVNRYGKPEVGS